MEDSGSALSEGTVFETGDGSGSVPVDTASLERGDMLSRYMLVERVGLGGMGVVWSAYDPELDRKLAIKLLRPRSDRGLGDLARTRLIREAQVMARINHPNVIKVHDVGEHDGQVFLAMEFVQGKTLGRWVRATRRDWREIVAMFVQAGRGLAAAHRMDLVHRDFKPANVLIGPDGRARVTDFGLARSVESEEEPPVSRTWSASRIQRFDPNPMVTPLTRTGSMLGTPAYMAPEQFEGGQFDARTDQFSFCVALWEALHHRRPFAGATIEDLRQAVCSGRIVPPPSDSRVPGVIDRALRRGLSVEPEARWPSMDALLDELSRDPASGRRRWLIAAALLASFGAALIVTPMLEDEPGSHAPEPCPDPRADLQGIWDPQRRDQLGLEIGQAQPERWTRIVAALDDYASAYVTVRNDRCEAGIDIELDPGARCLDHRLRWLAGTVTLLDSGDVHMIEGAEGLLAALPPIEACARPRYVEAAGFARSESPVRADSPTNVRGRMLAAMARAELGEVEQAADELRELMREVESLDHPPLRIAILIELARVEQLAGATERARARLEQAVNEATRSGYDVLAANAARMLIDVVGRDLGKPETGLRWAARSEAWDERIDAPMIHRAERLVAEAELRSALADAETAERTYLRALELLGVGEGELDPTMLDPAEARIVSRAFVGLATLALARGEHREARARLASVHALRLVSLGPKHIDTVEVALELAMLDATLGDWREASTRFASTLPQLRSNVVARPDTLARAMLEHARFALTRAELAPDQLAQAESLVREAVVAAPGDQATLTLAQLERLRGDFEQAERLLGLLTGVPALELAVTLERAELRLAQSDPERALAEFERVLSIVGEQPQTWRAEALAGKGRALLQLGREAEGQAELEQALAIWDELAPLGHPRSIVALELLASASGPESRHHSRAEALRASL